MTSFRLNYELFVAKRDKGNHNEIEEWYRISNLLTGKEEMVSRDTFDRRIRENLRNEDADGIIRWALTKPL